LRRWSAGARDEAASAYARAVQIRKGLFGTEPDGLRAHTRIRLARRAAATGSAADRLALAEFLELGGELAAALRVAERGAASAPELSRLARRIREELDVGRLGTSGPAPSSSPVRVTAGDPIVAATVQSAPAAGAGAWAAKVQAALDEVDRTIAELNRPGLHRWREDGMPRSGHAGGYLATQAVWTLEERRRKIKSWELNPEGFEDPGGPVIDLVTPAGPSRQRPVDLGNPLGSVLPRSPP
jgi:hypothetical protein